MSSCKYTEIYNYIKDKILSQEFKSGEKLPSENDLTSLFNVSRNTVRRAINMLASEGLVTSVHGKGVFVMEKKHLNFLVGGLQSFKEASLNNNIQYTTFIPVFQNVIVDEILSKKTGFSVGSEVLYILRVRNINNENVILDVNYFNLNVIKGITKEIAMNSIYNFIENDLNLKISGAEKIISVDPVSEIANKYLNLNGHNLVATITNFTYLDDGTLFEYTQSHHRPDMFKFNTFARRSYQ